MEQIQALIAEAMQSGTVDFGIVRNGASMTLSVPASALMDPRKTGGVLEPESR